MKHTSKIPVFLLALSILFSCKNDTKVDGEAIMKSVNTEVSKEKKDTPSNSELEKLKETLINKTPLTDEQLLRAFPKELMGFPLDEVNAIPGMSQVYGQFNNGKIALSIVDAAGNKNAAAITFLSFYEYVPPSNEKSKLIKIERDGFKTISDYKYNETEMKLLLDNRFMVNLSAKAMTPDELWETFDIGSLKEYKELNR
ncbi:hypothetical protein [Gelidibacter sp.]|uniref:hypothetical protein n=1 Tax=Gelidibacter sp. TaxID=2018083 RepID=UPI002C9899A3|nr:hypothetical protein [Gelidibacter sp.]HUH27306.1 hypothetical protein [Gelidibacter sp.]